MLAGRNRRKATSQLWGYIVFRWVAIWLLVAMVSAHGDTGLVAALVIAAVDIIAAGNFRTMLMTLSEMERRSWKDHLAQRLFYKEFWERLNSREAIDVDHLFSVSTQSSLQDIERADEDDRLQFGRLDSTAWHWFGGFLFFVSQALSCLLYYGSAIIMGGGRF